MKYSITIPFLLALLGLIMIIYCHYRTELQYKHLGGLSSLVTLYTYTKMEFLAINITQIIAISLSLIKILKQKKILPLAIIPLAFLNLFILWLGNPF